MEERELFLRDIDIMEILSFVDGKKSILQISKEVGSTYKTIFYKIKKLEDSKIIEFKNKKPTITKKYQTRVLMRVIDLKRNREIILKAMTNEEKKKRIIEGLSVLKTKRGISTQDFRKIITNNWKDFDAPMLELLSALEENGIIKERPELTRRGKKFLEEQK